MQASPDPRLPQYPVLLFASRYRKSLPPAAGVLIFLLGLWTTWRTGASDFAVLGIAFAVLGFFIVRGVLELIELVVELLIPR